MPVVFSLFCLHNVNMFDIIEGFGEGARAQIKSNVGDSSLFGGGGGSPMAANAYASSGYQSQFNNILSQTTPQQYQQITSRGSGNGWGSTGIPNYAGHAPPRPVHQPEFSPHIQQQFLKYERQLEMERRKNRSFGRGYSLGLRGDGILGQLFQLLEQIFKFILSILHLLIGWLF